MTYYFHLFPNHSVNNCAMRVGAVVILEETICVSKEIFQNGINMINQNSYGFICCLFCNKTQPTDFTLSHLT